MGDLNAAAVLPLSGITVVALEQAVAAPFASRQLADLGARVVKVERPGVGDFARHYDTSVKGLASYFVWLNRGKESLCLDLKDAAAADILDRLLTGADVFIHNLAPGAVDRLQLGKAVVRDRYPRLITCAISGYGTSGPYRERRAYDLLIQADAGLMSLTGTEDSPSRAGISVADIAAGMYAFSGILTALIARGQTGDGQWMEVSLLESLGEWMSYAAYFTKYGGTAPRRTGSSHPTIAPYGPFASSEGERIYLSVQNQREWVRFCTVVLEQTELISHPRFDTNAKRVENRAELQELVESAIARHSMAELVRRLDAAPLGWANLNSVHGFNAHPQLAARRRWREVSSPVGPLSLLIPPVTMEGLTPVMGEIPSLGQHTDVVLSRLGFDRDRIDELRRRGAV